LETQKGAKNERFPLVFYLLIHLMNNVNKTKANSMAAATKIAEKDYNTWCKNLQYQQKETTKFFWKFATILT
jgi:hypothetical protein